MEPTTGWLTSGFSNEYNKMGAGVPVDSSYIETGGYEESCSARF